MSGTVRWYGWSGSIAPFVRRERQAAFRLPRTSNRVNASAAQGRSRSPANGSLWSGKRHRQTTLTHLPTHRFRCDMVTPCAPPCPATFSRDALRKVVSARQATPWHAIREVYLSATSPWVCSGYIGNVLTGDTRNTFGSVELAESPDFNRRGIGQKIVIRIDVKRELQFA